MQKRITASFAGAVAFACAFGGDLPIYSVTETIGSGGVDLLSMASEYRTDALALGASGTVAVTGAVTHASGLTAENPFCVTNGQASSYFILQNAGLVGEVPLSVRGVSSSTTYFPNTTFKVDETHDQSLLRWRGTNLQIDNLTVSSKSADAPAQFNITNGTLYVRKNTILGLDGGTGTLYSAVTGLGRSDDTAVPEIGRRNDASVYLGRCTAAGKGTSVGRVHIAGGSLRCWNIYYGGDNAYNERPEGDGDAFTSIVHLDGGEWRFLCQRLHGSCDAVVYFNGGKLLSWGWGTFITFEANSSGNLVYEGQNGNPINAEFAKNSNFVLWNNTATGHLVFRGDSDVYLYAGDLQNGNLTTGSKFGNPRGLIDWNHTGDLHFKGTLSGHIAHLTSTNFFPHNSWNGGVVVNTGFRYLNLRGNSQRCNSLTGGGNITNSGARATITIGENNNDCAFNAVICANSPVDIVKEGTGTITLHKPVPGTFSLTDGNAVVASGATFSAGTFAAADGTYVEARGGTFVLPTGATQGDGASFAVTCGGTIQVGGDGDDEVVDLSRIDGDGTGIIEKVGSNTVTLQNASSYRGSIVVSGGTLACDASLAIGELASVEVASGATLSIASGLEIRTHALDVRGAAGEVDGVYGGTAAEGITALEGLSGAGTVRVTTSTAVWTGAVDDSAATVGNWKDLPVAPDVVSGAFTPVFAEGDANGAMDVPSAYAFAGMQFNSDVTSFLLNGTGSGSIALGSGGITAANLESGDSMDVNVSAPLGIAATQSWSVGTNSRLRVRSPISSASVYDTKITKSGEGTLYLYTTNSTYDGSVTLSQGTTYAYGNEPFGPSNATDSAVLRVEGIAKGSRLVCYNTVISKHVVLNPSGSTRNTLYFPAGTTNVFLGPVTYPGGNYIDGFDSAADSMVIFAGGIGESSRKPYVNWGTLGTVVITNKPLMGGTFENGAQHIQFYVQGNELGNLMAWSNNELSTFDNYNPLSVRFEFFVDWAFDCTTFVPAIGAAWDLHGHDQRFGTMRVGANGSVQSWDGPATLYIHHVDKPASKSQYVPPSTGDFKGQLSLVKEADGTFVISNRTVSATGTVTVVEGAVRLAHGAKWLNATNIVTTGGTFELTEAGQLGRETDFTLESGSLYIPDGVTQKARWLYLDGAEKPARPGVYGAADNTSVRAACRTSRITGTGVLNVLGDGIGLTIILR